VDFVGSCFGRVVDAAVLVDAVDACTAGSQGCAAFKAALRAANPT
jgi:hypothetical protein